MKKEPKITIIIPIINEGKHIIHLLESISNLDYKNYKTIIVMDKAINNKTYSI